MTAEPLGSVAPPAGTARLTFRPLTPADAPAVQRVYERTPAFFRLLGHPEVPPEAAERDLASRPPAPWSGTLSYFGLALAGSSELIGVLYLALPYPRPDVLWIALLLFDEAHQGQGYGREVVEALEAWAAGQPGITAIGLGVDEANEPALAFWRRLGYRPRDWWRDHPQPGTVGMVKRLRR